MISLNPPDRFQEKGAVQEGLARWVFKDVCSAVAYLHGIDIAHRDIKCENILLDMNLERYEKYGITWFAKVCDFGFARKCCPNTTLENPQVRNSSRILCYTLHYFISRILGNSVP